MSDEVLHCRDLDRAIALFARLGFRLDMIAPADDPSVALVSGHGVRVRLVRSGAADELDPDALARREWSPGAQARRPEGSEMQSEVPAEKDLLGGGLTYSLPAALPPLRPSFVVVRAGDSAWHTGRAGMQYRDLIPDRQGGRYIASHIRIVEGGPVSDYVHFHAIQFQIIYCYQGWVRLVYEDQGPPFVMQAGECVLQPPGIRHRVLEASPGLEVIEIGAPAVHATHVDHELALPTATVRADREFGGQRFVRYQPAMARFTAGPFAGFEACELGISDATRGIAAVRVLRRHTPNGAAAGVYRHAAELLLHVVLRGELTLDDVHRLGPGDAFVVPAGRPFSWRDASAELELLEVALPGEPAVERTAD